LVVFEDPRVFEDEDEDELESKGEGDGESESESGGEGASSRSVRHPSHHPILPQRDGEVAEGHVIDATLRKSP
jgi:hypothetical protein